MSASENNKAILKYPLAIVWGYTPLISVFCYTLMTGHTYLHTIVLTTHCLEGLVLYIFYLLFRSNVPLIIPPPLSSSRRGPYTVYVLSVC